jgi:hypothetical protein
MCSPDCRSKKQLLCIQNKENELLMLTHFVYCQSGSILLFSSNIYMNCIHQHFR